MLALKAIRLKDGQEYILELSDADVRKMTALPTNSSVYLSNGQIATADAPRRIRLTQTDGVMAFITLDSTSLTRSYATHPRGGYQYQQ